MSTPNLVAEFASVDRRLNLFPQSGALVIAVSGGPDSIVLLHLAARHLQDRPVRIVVGHLDHRLRPDSADDAAFVGRTAGGLGLEVVLGARDAAALAAEHGWSLEEAGRRARYAFLASVAASAGASVIATAHHADDQIETILLNLIRGTGLAGLAGMRQTADFPLTTVQLAEARPKSASPEAAGGQLTLVRPLLEVPRAAIMAYARDNDLDYRLDASNTDARFTRNRVRSEVIPALESLNPLARDALLRLAVIARAEDDYLQEAAGDAWTALTSADADSQRLPGAQVEEADRAPAVSRDPHGDPARLGIEAAALTQLHLALARRVIRRAAEATGADLRALGPNQVDTVLSIAANGGAATLPGGVNVARHGGRLVFAARATGQPPPPLPIVPQILTPPVTARLSSGWVLTVTARQRAATDPVLPGDPWRTVLDEDVVGLLSVRARVPGDKMAPLGMAGRTKSLQDLFVDEGVPAERRAGWPIVLGGFGVAWVPGLRMDERGRIRPGTTRVIEIEARPPWQVS